MSLYHKTKELVTRSTKNNPNRTEVFIPFSESMHTFAIKLEVELTIASFEYFCKEYKRQVILQVYDMEWKTFVLYMMGNLDRAEIEMLDNKYSKMTKDIHRIILRRLQYASIPFDVRNESNTNEEEDEKTDSVSSQKVYRPVNIAAGELCPCGSGKKYCECHGSNIRSNNKSKRRR